MSDETDIDPEERRDRHETAALLRALAADFDGAETFGLTDDPAVGVPAEMDVEVELDREEDEDGTAFELEVEIEWTPADLPESVDAETDRDAEPQDSEATDATAGGSGTAEHGTETGESEAEATEVEGVGTDIVADAESVAPPSLARFQVYRDRAEEWRWRLVHRNGNIIATSGEGYTTRQNAEKGLRSVMNNAPGAEVTRED